MATSSTVLDGGAIEAVANLAREAAGVTIIKDVGSPGHTFTDKPIHRVPTDPDLPPPLKFFTLAALVAYLQAEPKAESALVHVVGPTRVDVVGRLEGDDKHIRRLVALAECQLGPADGFEFNQYMAIERLNIALQTCFDPGLGMIEDLRRFCASVRGAEEIATSDDGVSQEVTAKAGIAAVTNVAVKNPWSLAPYRTFAEIPQPLSPFVLRFRKSDEGRPQAGIFRTGNAGWIPDTVGVLARWLRVSLGQAWTVLG